jgi:nucleotide-binding universal stress UspA family protein
MKTIVVGVDGSAGSDQAVRFAASEAAAHGATLRLVSAWEIPTSVLASGGVGVDMYGSFEAEAREILRDAAALVAELDRTVALQERTVEGHAGNVLIKEADDADLVVLGRRGHGGLSEFLLGSVSHQVADHAKCPVVIVPPAAAV